MSEHKHVIKFDVKTYPCKCGLEFSQEFAETLVEAALSGSLPTVQLGIDLEFEKRKVAKLAARIAELEHDLTNKEIEYTDLWDDALAFQSRIAELEAFINQLIEAGNALDVPPDDFSEEQKDWRELVGDWKEG